MRTPAVNLVAGALLLTAACGTDRPSVQDITRSLKNGKAGTAFGLPSGLSDTQYACMAKAIVDSDLSDQAVAAFAKGETATKVDEDDARKAVDVGTQVANCAAAS